MHLKDTLESYDIADIIANNRGVRRAVPQNFECDLYDYIGGRKSGNSAFHGSYLLNYSWGETTIDQRATGNVNVQRVQELLEAPDGGVSLTSAHSLSGSIPGSRWTARSRGDSYAVKCAGSRRCP